MNQLFLEIARLNGLVGDLAQRHNRVLIVIPINRDLGSRRDHAAAMRREQHEFKAVFNLVDTIFDSDTGHEPGLLQLDVVYEWPLANPGSAKAQAENAPNA
jgi:hypothetical protein